MAQSLDCNSMHFGNLKRLYVILNMFGLSVPDGLGVSETADLLRFLHTAISRVYRECSEKEKISSEQQLWG